MKLGLVLVVVVELENVAVEEETVTNNKILGVFGDLKNRSTYFSNG